MAAALGVMVVQLLIVRAVAVVAQREAVMAVMAGLPITARAAAVVAVRVVVLLLLAVKAQAA